MPKKVERGLFCFGMVLYFILEAFKVKYQVLMIKVHTVQKKWTVRVQLAKKIATVSRLKTLFHSFSKVILVSEEIVRLAKRKTH